MVTRNAKDTAVSMLHHTKNIPPFEFTGDWEQFAELFLAGRVESSCFWEWHKSWWQQAQVSPDAVLWVRFEDMKSDLPAIAALVSSYLGLAHTAEELDAVAERCGFVAMKKEADNRDADSAAKGEHVKKGHIREGKVGGWQSIMSQDTVAAFDARSAALHEDCGLDLSGNQ